jgi:L-fuconate dehydratase
MEDRVIEFVDHLHEHFLDPVRMVRGRYQLPLRPGYSIEMKPASLAAYNFDGGSAWKELA